MKRYETYKDSGIQWWEEIPTHWDLKKAKHIFSLVTENVSDSSLPKIALENIESWTGKYIETDSDFMGEGVEFKKDDILFGKLRPYLAKVYKAEFAGQAVGDIYVFRGNEEQNPEYLKYLLLSYPFISVVDGSTYGAKMPRANWDFISHLVLPCPPKTEQVTIAAFLDHKVGQIDATIAEKEQMLEDLKAYRSAIVSEAVTKGLDKNVEMKDSGIDKFPMIQFNWNTSKLKYIASIRSGSALPANNIKEDALYEVYGGNGCMGKADEYNTESPAIIIGRVGALCGNVHLIKTKKWVTDNALILNIKRDVTYEYLYYYLTAYDLNTLNSSNAQPLITGTKVLDVVTPMPSLNEQIMIANYLDDKTSMIDETIDQISVQIVELKSYKSSLITEAVTGKIDLRDWKPKEEKV